MRNICICLFLVFLVLGPVSGETVRGTGTKIITVDTVEERSIRFDFEDIVAINKSTTPFTYGLEIEVRLPRALRDYPETFLLSLFSAPSPRPEKTLQEYSANLIYQRIMPPSGRLIIQLPYSDDTSFEHTPGAVTIERVITSDTQPVLLSLYPVMKGLPSDVSSAGGTIIIRPAMLDRGGLSLSFSPGDVEPSLLDLQINNKPVTPDGIILLTPGIHHISLESPDYKSITRTFGIEQGKINHLSLTLEKKESRLIFDLPNNSQVFLNGSKIGDPGNTIIEVPPGQHGILFKMSDYSISKNLEVEAGRNYTISLFLDILIEED